MPSPSPVSGVYGGERDLGRPRPRDDRLPVQVCEGRLPQELWLQCSSTGKHSRRGTVYKILVFFFSSTPFLQRTL